MKRILPAALLCLACAASALLVCGCEHDDEDDSLDLTIEAHPDDVREGEACFLYAYLEDRGTNEDARDRDFTWSLGDTSLGYLSRTSGRRVVYHPTRFPAADEPELVQTVFCKFDGDFFSNGAVYNHHTRKKIHQLPPRSR